MKTKELLDAYASSIESLRRQVVLAQQALTRLEVAEERTPGKGPFRSPRRNERDLLEDAKDAAELIQMIQEHGLAGDGA